MAENGKSAEENQVSKTLSSCLIRTSFPSFSRALMRASFSVRVTIQIDSESLLHRYAGMRCPHHNCRDTHQSLKVLNRILEKKISNARLLSK